MWIRLAVGLDLFYSEYFTCLFVTLYEAISCEIFLMLTYQVIQDRIRVLFFMGTNLLALLSFGQPKFLK
jgi:hypothetical protein